MKTTKYVHAWIDARGIRDLAWFDRAADAEASYAQGASYRLRRHADRVKRVKDFLISVELNTSWADGEITQLLERELENDELFEENTVLDQKESHTDAQ